MSIFGSTQYGVRTTGTKVNVPDNPISKLQYYLNVVLGLIEIGQDDDLDRLRNYSSSSVTS